MHGQAEKSAVCQEQVETVWIKAHNGVEAALVVAGDARHRRQRRHAQRHRLQRTEIADIGLRPHWARWRKGAAISSQQFHNFAVAMLLFRRTAWRQRWNRRTCGAYVKR